MNQARILIVDDEIQIRRLLRRLLESEGYQTVEASNGKQGLQLAAASTPDLILLDLSLGDMDGLAVLQDLRKWFQRPVIVLTIRDSDDDKVALLDGGADDFVTKPFSNEELLARIRVALRHATSTGPVAAEFTTDWLTINFEKRQVFVAGQETHLTPMEYQILTLLARHSGRVLTQQQILKQIWGPGHEQEAGYLRVYVLQLRRKIERDSARPAIIVTEPGVGYRLKELPPITKES
ncbi:MAG: response regulator transcription factor [Spirochaetales bacterium]|nr:response regulator transcription factor [Leptospiraceae bacterium]MCB1327221.1 response regulator transcription factor [Leptospiraceae bacterium]MCP5479943.1 response regulator transcription factor [Spirochaetales bacterium]